MTTTQTTCPYCGVGCGVLATLGEGGRVSVKGDPDHPANFGKLCAKGLTLAETLVPQGRLLYPQVGGNRTSWNEATALIAEKFSAAIREHGPDSVAFYVSGQLLTEDYYVANKLMKGFIGSANIDTNSRLCMASAVAGHNRAFGSDVVPCNYEDLEEADLVVLVGSNLAWCHPILFQRLQAARERRGTKLVVIDPRRTASAEGCDLFLPIASGSDVALFNGLLLHLSECGHMDSDFVSHHTSGLYETLSASSEWTVEKVAAATGLTQIDVESFYTLFAKHARTITAFSMGVNQSTSGTDKVNAIINCHLFTGRIGKVGAGPFSITGQPNAMGGREVGGMANMLAAHMNIANADHRDAVQKFWASPRIANKPGLKAVDLFKAVGEGKIKALWIMGTNPAVSMPDSGQVAAALKRCEFVVVSDVMAKTDTTRYAHVLLPAQGWGEKNGTVTNSERRISRQRQFANPAGEARADWNIICDVAKAMGFSGFDFTHASEIFAEHVALTQIENNGTRALDLKKWHDANYDALEPKQWGGTRPFADGKFQTPDGLARFIPTVYQPAAVAKLQFTLNTGRIRDQWHTMTRTGLVPKLLSHRAEPFIEISCADAARLKLKPADLAEITSDNGKSIARVLITDAVRAGNIFQPMHWNSTFAPSGLVNANSVSVVDPHSGQPALKSASVSIQKKHVAWHGCGVSTARAEIKSTYWATSPLAHGTAFECADDVVPDDWMAWIEILVSTYGFDISTVMSADQSSFRCVALKDNRLQFAFFASGEPVAVSRSWLHQQLGREVSAQHVLAGRPAASALDHGPTVCSCNGVGRNIIRRAAYDMAGSSLSAICEKTNAGMGCGSCRPEVQRIINETTITRIAAE
jgi:assimilatory nitrate reductase catalytic subunit